MLAREAGIVVPLPITFQNNVLLLEFIGRGDEIAPKLKDKIPKDKKKFFEDIMDNLKKLYQAGIVHADISGFNILNFEENPVFIDMSQATTLKHPDAERYLKRDVKNLCAFFKKYKVDVDEEETLKKIRG